MSLKSANTERMNNSVLAPDDLSDVRKQWNDQLSVATIDCQNHINRMDEKQLQDSEKLLEIKRFLIAKNSNDTFYTNLINQTITGEERIAPKKKPIAIQNVSL